MTGHCGEFPSVCAIRGSGFISPYMIFAVGPVAYAIELGRIRQVIGISAYRLALGMQPFITGMIELQGWIIPVMDLRRRFGTAALNTDLTCVVVVDVLGDNGDFMKMGIVVDALLEALNIRSSEIETVSPAGISEESPWIVGRVRSGQKHRIILDIDLLFGHGHVRYMPRAA